MFVIYVSLIENSIFRIYVYMYVFTYICKIYIAYKVYNISGGEKKVYILSYFYIQFLFYIYKPEFYYFIFI